jgi:hypothetical protein
MKPLPKIAILDTETLDLKKFNGCIWEVAVITGDPYDDGSGYKWGEYVWHLKPDLSKADPGALRVNRLYERMAAGEVPHHRPTINATDTFMYVDGKRVCTKPMWRDSREAAQEVATVLANRTIIGAVPNFDTERLEEWLKANGQCGAWKYHLVDVEALVAGYLRGLLASVNGVDFFDQAGVTEEEVIDLALPDWRSTDLLEAAGIAPPPSSDRHTALGDCRWARNAYAKVYGIAV